ncbi:MAG: hypothetical protein WBF34_28015 [Streptosporangiaceae bacterium]
MSGGKKGVALAGGVSLLLGSSVGALTVWLAKRVMGDRGTGSAGCHLHVLCVGRAYREWDKADRRAADADKGPRPRWPQALPITSGH